MIDKELTGKKLVLLRKRMKISQNQLSEHLGVSAAAISKWENGRSLPDIEMLVELSKLYNVSLNTILEGGITSKGELISKSLPADIKKIPVTRSRMRLLGSVSSYFSDLELIDLAKQFADNEITFRFATIVKSKKKGNKETRYIVPVSSMSDETLSEIAPVVADILSTTSLNINKILKSIIPLMQCPKCGTPLVVMINPKTDQEIISCRNGHTFNINEKLLDFNSKEWPGIPWASFIRNEQEYDQNFVYTSSIPHFTHTRRKMFDDLYHSVLTTQKPSTILLLDQGTGRISKQILEKTTWPCTALVATRSHHMLRLISDSFRNTLMNPKVDMAYLACDHHNLPFKDDMFDAIIADGFTYAAKREVVEHQISEARRVLKPGGKILFKANCVRNTADTAKWKELISSGAVLDESIDSDEYIRQLFTIDNWLSMAESCGIHVQKKTKIFDQIAPTTEITLLEMLMMMWMGEYLIEGTK